MKRSSHDGSSIFHRGSSKGNQRLTPIEACLDQILVELDDSSPIVEYWSRSNYINMDAHADIDEDVLKDEGVLRCPSNGHVLYMQIASGNLSDDDNNIDYRKEVMACPTVVFPTRKIAWGSVTPISIGEEAQEYVVDVENYWSEEEKQQYGYIRDIDEDKSDEMVIVPAVNGRLLRFDGAAFHAVPRPADRFLMGEQDLALFLEREREEEEEEEEEEDDDYGDNDDDDYDDMEEENTSKRSVILFNTWPEGSNGPRGVLPDRIIDSVPDGISIGDEDLRLEDEQWNRWEDIYGKKFETINCNPSSEWTLEEVTTVSGDIVRDVTIPLMGNPSRRGCIQTEDTLKGSVLSENIL